MRSVLYTLGWILVFVGAAEFQAVAQWQLIPYSSAPTARPSGARTQAISLPFFDDFSLARNGVPDPTLWVTGGGTVVNNTMTTNHPTVNVVTFDGLKRDGLPYDFNSQLAQGETDSLTSQPINLTGMAPRDSLYLSFFWVMRGLGDQPDATDSLRVQFLTSGNVWQTAWIQKGGLTTTTFTQVLIPIRATAYFHGAFQFRFQAFGRKSGAFDAWHIDYVYLNRGRNRNDRFYKDVAMRRPITSYLKRYRAMPLSHYLINPAAEVADTISTDISNLFNNNNFTLLRFRLRETTTNQQFQSFSQSIAENIPLLASQAKRIVPTAYRPASGATRAAIQATFEIQTTDNQDPSIPGVDLRRNDTLSSVTELSDYFAYDDGTAEYAAGINQKFAYVAVRYILRKADVVSAVRMQTVRYRTDIQNQTFALFVLNNKNGKPGTVLTRQSFPARYPASPTGFAEFKLQNPVAVRDTFWVAYQQLSEDQLAIGLDKNTTQFVNQIYYNLGNEWTMNTTLAGALMIRPVMGGQASDIVTGVEEINEKQLQVFPNPTNGAIRWNIESFHTAELFDLSGRKVWEARNLAEPVADFSGFNAGMYLLRLSSDKQTFTKKLVLEK